MKYQIILKKRAKKFIDRLPPKEQKRLVEGIEGLPGQGDRKAMAGHPGLYRLRVGDYRVLYRVEDDRLVVFVTDAGNRGDIYK